MEHNNTLIREDDYVIIRKDDHQNVYQVKPRKVWFGKVMINLEQLINQPFGAMFKLENKELKRIPFAPNAYSIDESTAVRDNRFLSDDGKSQKLTKEDIDSLKEQGKSGQEIVEKLVENSSTFQEKTSFSKEKYLKKKVTKYLPKFIVCKPNTRLLCELYSSRSWWKTMSLRVDSLGTVLAMANVHSEGRYMVFETCTGLVTGAVLDRLGGRGCVVHLHNGDTNQSKTVQMYNFGQEEKKCLHYLDVNDIIASKNAKKTSWDLHKGVSFREESIGNRTDREKEHKRFNKLEDAKRAFDIIKTKNMDGLIIASHFHPTNIALFFLNYLVWSRPFVIYSNCQEPLVECFHKLKETGQAINLQLVDMWHRKYQVLPDRTHPEVNMSGTGGYILSGIAVEKNTVQCK